MFSIAGKSNNDYSDGREKSPFIKKNRYSILKFQDPETKQLKKDLDYLMRSTA